MEALDELEDTHNIKNKKGNKFWRKLSDQHEIKSKNKNEAYNNKRNVLEHCSLRIRLGSRVNDNFLGTFVDFCLKIFSQERIGTYDDPCP